MHVYTFTYARVATKRGYQYNDLWFCVTSIVREKIEEEKVDDVEPAAIPVPQLKIGPDGQIILDPQSLVSEEFAQVETSNTHPIVIFTVRFLSL